MKKLLALSGSYKNRQFVWQMAALGVILTGTLATVLLTPSAKKNPKPLTIAELARKDRAKVDESFNSPQAKGNYEQFIDRWKDNPDKEVQDQVGAARIRLAYATAKDKDWKGAHQIFREAALQYKGTGTMGGDFGGIKDQALYQAAACLNGEGKTAEARRAFLEFMQTQPMSTLVNAAYKRIVKMDGKSSPEIDNLLQADLNKQAKKIRFETSVCGPKAIVKLLAVLRHSGKSLTPNPLPQRQTALSDGADYQLVAKLCGTTDKGTSLEGLRKGLKAFGLDYFGYQIPDSDLQKIETPAILFTGDHYLLVTAVSASALTIYDPMTEKEDSVDVAKFAEQQKGVILLLKSPPASVTRTP